MKTIYESVYQKIQIVEEKKVLEKVWFPATEDMGDKEFKSEVEKIAEIAEKYKIEKFYDNTSDFAYPIVPQVQTWVNETIFPRFIEAGLKKYAIIVSQEAISQLSIEQTMEEDNASAFQVKYFSDTAKAREWLDA